MGKRRNFFFSMVKDSNMNQGGWKMIKKFDLLVDSCCDLPYTFLEEENMPSCLLKMSIFAFQ